MADFETKLRWLSERGNPVGAEELIERIEAELAGDPLVVVAKRRDVTPMTKSQESPRADQPNRYRGPAWGLATVVAVLTVGVLYLALSANENQVADTAPPTPTTTLDLFTEIAPGEMVELPDWPLSERTAPPMVWTGAELVIWGDGIYGLAGDGAAFDPANGTWRVIAEAPISPRSEHAAVWTGTEMILWGGRVEDSFYRDGAAYNPSTDTWRLLSPPPPSLNAPEPKMVWTGNEAVVLSEDDAAAYDPITDTWRTLAHSPFGVHWEPAWWTGDSIVVADVSGDPEFDQMARYDLVADRWTMVDVGSSTAVVGVSSSDGRVSTFLNLPSEAGAPVRLIDSTGSLLAELPAFPGDPGVFGDEIGAYGLWVGDEAVFEIWKVGPDYEPEQIWALNPSEQTWRRLDADTAFPRLDYSTVVAGDVLLMWNRPGDVYQGPPRVCCVAPPGKGGSAYRVGIAPSD